MPAASLLDWKSALATKTAETFDTPAGNAVVSRVAALLPGTPLSGAEPMLTPFAKKFTVPDGVPTLGAVMATVAVNVVDWPNERLAGDAAKMVSVAAGAIVNAKLCVTVPLELLAEITMGYVPAALGIPLRIPDGENDMPGGSMPVSLKVGAGKPEPTAANEAEVPKVKVA